MRRMLWGAFALLAGGLMAAPAMAHDPPAAVKGKMHYVLFNHLGADTPADRFAMKGFFFTGGGVIRELDFGKAGITGATLPDFGDAGGRIVTAGSLRAIVDDRNGLFLRPEGGGDKVLAGASGTGYLSAV
jgi:hypothetical protein